MYNADSLCIATLSSFLMIGILGCCPQWEKDKILTSLPASLLVFMGYLSSHIFFPLQIKKPLTQNLSSICSHFQSYNNHRVVDITISMSLFFFSIQGEFSFLFQKIVLFISAPEENRMILILKKEVFTEVLQE